MKVTQALASDKRDKAKQIENWFNLLGNFFENYFRQLNFRTCF